MAAAPAPATAVQTPRSAAAVPLYWVAQPSCAHAQLSLVGLRCAALRCAARRSGACGACCAAAPRRLRLRCAELCVEQASSVFLSWVLLLQYLRWFPRFCSLPPAVPTRTRPLSMQLGHSRAAPYPMRHGSPPTVAQVLHHFAGAPQLGQRHRPFAGDAPSPLCSLPPVSASQYSSKATQCRIALHCIAAPTVTAADAPPPRLLAGSSPPARQRQRLWGSVARQVGVMPIFVGYIFLSTIVLGAHSPSFGTRGADATLCATRRAPLCLGHSH